MDIKDKLNLHAFCLPGQRKLFVRYDGKFFPCERSPEYDSLCIGDCYTGIDAKKAYQLLVDFHALTKNDCLNCWAYNLCNEVCYVHVCDKKSKQLSAKVKQERCEKFRQKQENIFINMLSMHEKNPQALEFLNSYVIS